MSWSKLFRFVAGAGACLLGISSVHAALLDEGNGQLYDNVTGLVWMQNANLAATDTFGVSGIRSDGYMDWSTANSWIAAMNAADYLGHADWRLPSVSPVDGTSFNYNYANNGTTDVGYNITSPASELSYMYYVNLGLKGLISPSGSVQSYEFGIFGNGTTYGQANVGPVQNLQSYAYWSGVADPRNPTSGAWLFKTLYGNQDADSNTYPLVSWAVRSADAGDIAAVPEPETYAMMLAGLGLLGFAARRRKLQA